MPGCSANCTETRSNVPFSIPALAPSNCMPESSQDVIRIRYFLVFKLIPLSGLSLTVQSEIQLGTVPLVPARPPTSDTPSAPPEYLLYNDNINNNVRAVSFCPTPKGTPDSLLDYMTTLNYGTESCRPRYPVFDLEDDFVDDRFEFL